MPQCVKNKAVTITMSISVGFLAEARDLVFQLIDLSQTFSERNTRELTSFFHWLINSTGAFTGCIVTHICVSNVNHIWTFELILL